MNNLQIKLRFKGKEGAVVGWPLIEQDSNNCGFRGGEAGNSRTIISKCSLTQKEQWLLLEIVKLSLKSEVYKVSHQEMK